MEEVALEDMTPGSPISPYSEADDLPALEDIDVEADQIFGSMDAALTRLDAELWDTEMQKLVMLGWPDDELPYGGQPMGNLVSRRP